MKKILSTLCIVALSATTYAQADTDIVNIPDTSFKTVLLSNYYNIDSNKDGQISYGEAKSFNGNIFARDINIKSLKGIEAFVNLKGLYCEDIKLTELDISKNINLLTQEWNSTAKQK